jgi:hypothetical protein
MRAHRDGTSLAPRVLSESRRRSLELAVSPWPNPNHEFRQHWPFRAHAHAEPDPEDPRVEGANLTRKRVNASFLESTIGSLLAAFDSCQLSPRIPALRRVPYRRKPWKTGRLPLRPEAGVFGRTPGRIATGEVFVAEMGSAGRANFVGG